MAEYAGDSIPDRMQRLLERASWDTLAAMGTVRDVVTEHFGRGDGPAMLVLDESGVEKSGTRLDASAHHADLNERLI